MTAMPLPQSIRASVFHAPGQPLELQEFPTPTLAADEILVRIDCCTLCGSDLHTYLGRRHGPAPSVLGHEMVGRIAAFGPAHNQLDWRGAALAIGDQVSWAVAASCGDCYFCHHELPQKCQRLFKYGHECCAGAHPLSGGLAEFCHLATGSAILRVPEGIPDAVASSANCATATAAAAFRAAGGCHDKSVLIQGAGLLGLTAAAMAHADGASHVFVADVDPARLATATRFGATATINVQEGDTTALAAQIHRATDNRGVDVAFEMSGAPTAVPQGLTVLRPGGRYILVGAVRPVGDIPLEVEQVVRRMWRLEGVHNYAPRDLAAALDFLAAHPEFPFAEQVAGEFSLHEVDTAFARMIDAKAIRVAVRPYK